MVAAVMRAAVRNHIPTPEAPWITLKKINTTKFRDLDPRSQAGLLNRHYSGLGKLGDDAFKLGGHAEKTAKQIRVQPARATRTRLLI
jgi:hypothetical protein